MRVLLWHVHGSWTTSFVQGPHDYLLPVTPDRGPEGRGRARTWTWPASAVEVTPAELAGADLDVVVLQRPEELALAEAWTGRRPGRDLPAVYVEHNTPGGEVPNTRHPVADRGDLLVAHVTHFNRLVWDTGRTPTTVVEHGVVDPGPRHTGEVRRAGVAINEPVRRGRAVGTDLLPLLADVVPLDVFGMGVTGVAEALGLPPARLAAHEDLPQERMHAELARRAIYLHLHRWTSLGLALIEAMMLAMPVAGLAMTEAAEVVPPEAAALTNDLDRLQRLVRGLLADPEEAAALGRRGRELALARFGLARFLADWDALLDRTVSDLQRRRRASSSAVGAALTSS
jgi:glycosyltransferase involved in cell wall biosynthesis